MLNKLSLQDEGSRAQHWRQEIMRLSIKDLSELTGYSITAIRCFEANANTAGELFGEAAWLRYRNACAGACLSLRSAGIFGDAVFNWTQGGTRADTR